MDLKVKEGEIFGVLGPNGAGKTTMIRILSRLLLSSSGSARVTGWDVAKQPEKVRPLISTASGAERGRLRLYHRQGNLWFFSQLYGLSSKLAHEWSFFYYLGLSLPGGLTLLVLGILTFKYGEGRARRLGVLDRKVV